MHPTIATKIYITNTVSEYRFHNIPAVVLVVTREGDGGRNGFWIEMHHSVLCMLLFLSLQRIMIARFLIIQYIAIVLPPSCMKGVMMVCAVCCLAELLEERVCNDTCTRVDGKLQF